MPTYAYACTECDHRFDAVQSFSDDALTDCPECSGRLRKLFSAVGIVFKGSGFYRNDSRAQANGKAKSAENGGGKESGGKEKGKEPAAAATSGTSSTSSPSSSSTSSSSTAKPSSSSTGTT